MLGYIQAHDFRHWHDCINGWVDELSTQRASDVIWNDDDKLREMFVRPLIASYRSSNLRRRMGTGDDALDMFHLWVLLTQVGG